jgi:hypothetical protein
VRDEIHLLNLIVREILRMASAIDDLTAAVAAESTAIDSAITLLNQLTTLVTNANAVSPAAVEAVVTDIQAKTAALAAAVTQNTPAA